MFDSIVLFGDNYFPYDTAIRPPGFINRVPLVYAKPGQTPTDIAKEHELGTWEIYKYNDLKKGEALDPGEIVYLKPKRRKGSSPLVLVAEGQSMRQVSQQQGIKLKQLYKKNHLKTGQEVKPGQTLYLQRKSAIKGCSKGNQYKKVQTIFKKMLDRLTGRIQL